MSAQRGCINTASYITDSFEDTELRRLYSDKNCVPAAVAAPHQTVCHASSPGVLLRFSLEHSVTHGVTSLCEYQRLCTEIALRYRDVNYKGVTVSPKDVESMFIVLAQRICLSHRLTSTNTTEIESFAANDKSACGLPAALCHSIRWNSALFFCTWILCGNLMCFVCSVAY